MPQPPGPFNQPTPNPQQTGDALPDRIGDRVSLYNPWVRHVSAAWSAVWIVIVGGAALHGWMRDSVLAMAAAAVSCAMGGAVLNFYVQDSRHRARTAPRGEDAT